MGGGSRGEARALAVSEWRGGNWPTSHVQAGKGGGEMRLH